MRQRIGLRYPILSLALAVIGCDETRKPGSAEEAIIPSVSVPAEQLAKRSNSPSPSNIAASDSIDPKGAEGARTLLTTYAGLLEGRRWTEARQLWTEGSDSKAVEDELKPLEQFKVEVGDPGPAEGAAGSIYIGIPVNLTGETKSGETRSLAGTATLRRVNDVPGSTEVQRRWHIYSLDLQPRP